MSLREGENKLTNDDVVGLIVHAYNNFLSGMMGYSELTLLDCENPSQIEYLNQSMESGHEAVHFGKALLASIGRLQVDMKHYSLEELLKSTIESSDLEITIDNFEPYKNIRILTDMSWFQECFMDLLLFISTYRKTEKINISLELKEESKNLRVSIFTEEITLSDDDIKNLFIPFYSSKILLGEKDIGLSKAKGFFGQMNADLSWANGEGFLLEVSLC